MAKRRGNANSGRNSADRLMLKEARAGARVANSSTRTMTQQDGAPARPEDSDPGEFTRPLSGVRNTNFNDYNVYVDGRLWNPDKIPLSVYDLMRRTDPTISAALAYTRLAVSNKLGNYSHKDEEIQEFTRSVINRMQTPFRRAVGEWVHTAHWAGSGVMELVWNPGVSFEIEVGNKTDGERTLSYNDMTMLWDMQVLKPETVTYRVKIQPGDLYHGKVEYVEQNAYSADQALLPVEKCAIYSHRMEFGNPYGISRLQPIYKFWWLYDVLERAYGRTLERYGSPIILGQTDQINKPIEGTDGKPSTVTRGQALLRVLEDLHDNSVIVHEPDQVIEVLVSSKAVGKDFLDALEFLDRGKLRGLLFPSLIFDNTDVGSHSLGEGHQDVLTLSLNEVLLDVNDLLIGSVFAKLIYYNFGPQEDYGKFDLIEIKAEDLERWSNIVAKLTGISAVDMAYLEDLNVVREKFGFEVMDEVFKQPDPMTEYDADGNPIQVPGDPRGPGARLNPPVPGSVSGDPAAREAERAKAREAAKRGLAARKKANERRGAEAKGKGAGKSKGKPSNLSTDEFAMQFEQELRQHLEAELRALR